MICIYVNLGIVVFPLDYQYLAEKTLRAHEREKLDHWLTSRVGIPRLLRSHPPPRRREWGGVLPFIVKKHAWKTKNLNNLIHRQLRFILYSRWESNPHVCEDIGF